MKEDAQRQTANASLQHGGVGGEGRNGFRVRRREVEGPVAIDLDN